MNMQSSTLKDWAPDPECGTCHGNGGCVDCWRAALAAWDRAVAAYRYQPRDQYLASLFDLSMDLTAPNVTAHGGVL